METYTAKTEMNYSSMLLSPTDGAEIRSLIMTLPVKNSSGYDEVSNNLLKKLCISLLNPLEIIFSKSLMDGENG